MYRLEVGAIDACTRACVRAFVTAEIRTPWYLMIPNPLCFVCVRVRVRTCVCVYEQERKETIYSQCSK